MEGRNRAREEAYGEVGVSHLFRQPVNLSLGVAEDDGLGDGQGVVAAEEVRIPTANCDKYNAQIGQGLEPVNRDEISNPKTRNARLCYSLELFLFDGDKELPDALQRQLITLDQDPDRVCHKLGSHLEHIVRQRCRQDDDLCRGRQVSVNVVDLILEALVEQFVGFIEHEHLDVLGAERASADHVEYTARGTRDDMLAVLELFDILADARAADTGVALNVHVVSQGENDILDLHGEFTCRGKDERLAFPDGGVDGLEDGDAECRGFTRSRLGLGDDVSAGDDGQDGSLLDGRGLFKICRGGISRDHWSKRGETLLTVCVDTPQEILLQAKLLDCQNHAQPDRQLVRSFLMVRDVENSQVPA